MVAPLDNIEWQIAPLNLRIKYNHCDVILLRN